ncbi:Sulfoxide reductase catalytic subunit YedY [Alicycliphilus sp. B1]|nr:Sulfoxide reductase catalytic subunit YedY [Alicycliphilus sp. B1]
MYGEVLPNQNGAPVRIVVPWKYGFRAPRASSRSASPRRSRHGLEQGRSQRVRLLLQREPRRGPPALEPGPERRIGEDGLFAKKRKTLLFNGYEAQVGQLYAGMDLKKFY